MCGICCVVSGSISTPEVDVFKNLLFVSQLRGKDSTGVFSVDKPESGKNKNHHRVLWYKEPYDASVFLETNEEPKQKILTYGHRALVGHCRWATKGNINAKNSHPFNFKNVIGVHNGTIQKKFDFTDQFETDSEALYANINEKGIEETVNHIEAYDTAYALIYYDKRDDTLNFIRNADRPLYFAYNSYQSTLFVASEAEMIEFIAKRKNIALHKDSPWLLKPHTLFSLPMDASTAYDVFKGYTSKTLTVKKTYPVTQGHFRGSTYYSGAEYGAYGDWDEDLPAGRYTASGRYTTKNAEPPFVPDKKVETKVIEHQPITSNTHPDINPGGKKVNTTQIFFHGWQGAQISKLALERILTAGCSSCRKPILICNGIDQKIGWAGPDQPVCEPCGEDKWVAKNIIKYRMTAAKTINPNLH